MRILAFSDTHGATDLTHLHERASSADLVLCGGDFTTFSHEIGQALDALESLAEHAEKPVVFTHGNHEFEDLRGLVADRPLLRYLHEEVHDANSVFVVGYGGGGFATKDPAAAAFLARTAKDHTGKPHVWLFHGPPHDTVVDERPGWGPTGCESKRHAIEQHEPLLVVAGHIHEGAGKTGRVGKTTIINPGPDGMLVELLEDELEVDVE